MEPHQRVRRATSVTVCAALVIVGFGWWILAAPAGAAPSVGPEKAVSPDLPSPGSQADVAVASDGTNFLVVWEDALNVWGVRTNAQGGVLGHPFFIATGQHPAVAWIGNRYVVVSVLPAFGGIVVANSVSASGSVLDSHTLSTPGTLTERPAIAVAGSNVLVAWQQRASQGAESDVVGVLSTSGFSPGSPFPIAAAAGDQATPDVGATSGQFLVAWHDTRTGSDARAARVTTAGAVQAPELNVATTTGGEVAPDVTSDGTGYLVAWTLEGASDDVRARLVTTAGALGTAQPISTATAHQRLPAAAWDGTDFVVAWQDGRNGNDDVFAARVSKTTGAVLAADANGVPISDAAAGQADPALAWNGSRFLVAWEDARNGPLDAFGRPVTSSLGLPTAALLLSRAPSPSTRPAIAYDGTNFLVVWEDRRTGSSDLYGARVDAGGTVVAPGVFLVSGAAGDQTDPTVDFAPGGTGTIAWVDGRSGTSLDVYGTTIGTSGGVSSADGDPLAANASLNEVDPDLVQVGGFIVLATAEQTGPGGDYDIYSRSTGATQRALVSGAIGDQRAPAVAIDDVHGQALFVWSDNRPNDGKEPEIFAARATQADGVLDPNGLRLTNVAGEQLEPDVTYFSKLDDPEDPNSFRDGYAVVWTDERSDASGDIYGAGVDESGALGASSPISTAAGEQSAPRIAWDGSKALVAWRDRRSGNFDVYGTYVADGAIESPDGFQISALGTDEDRPALDLGGNSKFGATYSRVVPTRASPPQVFFRSVPK